MRHGERGTRSGQPGQDQSGPDQVLEALLAGCPLPDEDQAGLQPVADVLAALRRPAAAAELTGQDSALAGFRAQPRRGAGSAQPRRRRGPVLGPLLRPRPALLVASAAMLAGLAAGGYEGDLPAPVQQWAHHAFGLTAVRGKASPARDHPGRRATIRAGTPGPVHHGHDPAHRDQPAHRQRPAGDSQRATDRGKRRPDGSQGTPGPSPASGPSGAPTPGGQATPGASSAPTPGSSTSPAAQPSAQSSTSPGPQHPHSSPSSPP